jgi:hypothetical protein
MTDHIYQPPVQPHIRPTTTDLLLPQVKEPSRGEFPIDTSTDTKIDPKKEDPTAMDDGEEGHRRKILGFPDDLPRKHTSGASMQVSEQKTRYMNLLSLPSDSETEK